MTDVQENQLNMFLRVKQACDDFRSTWESNQRFTANYTALLENLAGIETQRKLQAVNTTGISQNKNSLKEDLIEQTAFVAKAVKSYATDVNNPELAANVDYSASKLRNLRENALTATCQVVHDKCREYVDQLGDYGITAPVLAELLTDVQAYQRWQLQPQTARSNGKTATQKLSELFGSTAQLLKNQMDGKVEQYKRTAPDFYVAYINARKVVSRGKSPSSKEETAA